VFATFNAGKAQLPPYLQETMRWTFVTEAVTSMAKTITLAVSLWHGSGHAFPEAAHPSFRSAFPYFRAVAAA
jgi:hypothetical protein